MAGRPQLRLPAQPLLDRIARNGGLAAVMADAGMNPEDSSHPSGTSDEYRRLHKTLENGEKRGWFAFFWVDETIIELFRVHPMSIYGEAFLNPIDPRSEAELVLADLEPETEDRELAFLANAA